MDILEVTLSAFHLECVVGPVICKSLFHGKLNLLKHLFSLNVNFIFLLQREYDRGVQDCDSALCVSEGSRRALYRKALCMREMGRLREAYECGTKCLLTAPHVCHQHRGCQCKNFIE